MRANRLVFSCLLTALILTGSALGQGRVPDGLQALYGFQEEAGPTVQDISGVGSPLDLTIADPGAVSWIPGGGLTITSPTLISSGGPAPKIIGGLTATNALTIEPLSLIHI